MDTGVWTHVDGAEGEPLWCPRFGGSCVKPSRGFSWPTVGVSSPNLSSPILKPVMSYPLLHWDNHSHNGFQDSLGYPKENLLLYLMLNNVILTMAYGPCLKPFQSPRLGMLDLPNFVQTDLILGSSPKEEIGPNSLSKIAQAVGQTFWIVVEVRQMSQRTMEFLTDAIIKVAQSQCDVNTNSSWLFLAKMCQPVTRLTTSIPSLLVSVLLLTCMHSIGCSKASNTSNHPARNALESGHKDGKLRQLLQLLLPIDQRQFNFLDTEPSFRWLGNSPCILAFAEEIELVLLLVKLNEGSPQCFSFQSAMLQLPPRSSPSSSS
eukprot:Gb_00860 [translate_table: standard]